jgi:hypothetical protein
LFLGIFLTFLLVLAAPEALVAKSFCGPGWHQRQGALVAPAASAAGRQSETRKFQNLGFLILARGRTEEL